MPGVKSNLTTLSMERKYEALIALDKKELYRKAVCVKYNIIREFYECQTDDCESPMKHLNRMENHIDSLPKAQLTIDMFFK